MSSSSIIGVVRLRQIAEAVRHRLSFIPIVYVLGSIVLVQLLLWIDSEIGDAAIPAWLETTVDSARSVFGAIAGGLITSITLLLSMMLVTVQLASSQFSPRTLRDWLGNRDMQNALGFVLGTTVFCLLALRSTRTSSRVRRRSSRTSPYWWRWRSACCRSWRWCVPSTTSPTACRSVRSPSGWHETPSR